MPHAPKTDQSYEMLRYGIIRSPSYSSVLSHVSRVHIQFYGDVTFNTQRQQHKFMNCPGAEMDTLFVIYHENHIKCHYLQTLAN